MTEGAPAPEASEPSPSPAPAPAARPKRLWRYIPLGVGLAAALYVGAKAPKERELTWEAPRNAGVHEVWIRIEDEGGDTLREGRFSDVSQAPAHQSVRLADGSYRAFVRCGGEASGAPWTQMRLELGRGVDHLRFVVCRDKK